MTVPILAGFECGHLGWSNHDLLETTGHVPNEFMGEHYTTIKQHGITRVRDGLPWRHDPKPRLEIAAALDMDVIWDLNHYDPPRNAVAHARNISEAAWPYDGALWVCAVNEPSLYPAMCGLSKREAVTLATTMLSVLHIERDIRSLTTDPIDGLDDEQYEATDALVNWGFADMIGVNYYPHTARESLKDVLLCTWERYHIPILVSETDWHDGHPEHHRRHPTFHKGWWLQHVIDEVEAARAEGAQIEGICWYPIVDCPPWDDPTSDVRWSHGLIRRDLSVDPCLSAKLMERLT